MSKCAVLNCRKSRYRAGKTNVELVIHSFPQQDDLYRSWIEFCRQGENWKPTGYFGICSYHFRNEDYQLDIMPYTRNGKRSKILCPNAIPTIFESPPYSECVKKEEDANLQNTTNIEIEPLFTALVLAPDELRQLELDHILLEYRDKFCRICLKHCEDSSLVSVDSQLQNMTVLDMLIQLTAFETEHSEEFPTVICVDCCNILEQAYNTRQRFIAQSELLVQLVAEERLVEYFRKLLVESEEFIELLPTTETVGELYETASYDELMKHDTDVEGQQIETVEQEELSDEHADVLESNADLSYEHADVLESNADLTYEHADVLESNADLTYEHADVLDSNADLSYEHADVLDSNADLSYEHADVLDSNADLTYEQVDVLESNADGTKIHADVLESKADLTNEHADVLESNADGTNEHANVLDSNADVTNKHADVLESKADGTNEHADVLELKADVTNEHADVLESKADVTNEHADVLESKADVTNEHADVLESKTDVTYEQSTLKLDDVSTVEPETFLVDETEAKSEQYFKQPKIPQVQDTPKTRVRTSKRLWESHSLADEETRNHRKAEILREKARAYCLASHRKKYQLEIEAQKCYPFTTCYICDKTHDTLMERDFHMREHNSMLPYQCAECTGTVENEENQSAEHLTKDQPILLKTMNQLNAHFRMHHMPFKCDKCYRRFCTDLKLKNHHWSTHGIAENGLTCEYCGKQYFNRTIFTRHVAYHRSMLNGEFKCEVCERLFGSKSSLHRHEASHKGEKKFKCAFCDKMFSTSYNRLTHQRIAHTEERPFKCNECGRGFVDSSRLKLHLESHTSAALDGKYKIRPSNLLPAGKDRCPYPDCDFKAQTYSLMYMHKRKKHMCVLQCELCSKSFSFRADLKSHMLIHTGEKPFKCEQCNRSFRRGTMYRRHLLTHDPEVRPHLCTVCKKSFKMARYLQAHMHTHSLERKHLCDKCRARFKTKGELKRHRHLKHLVVEEAILLYNFNEQFEARRKEQMKAELIKID